MVVPNFDSEPRTGHLNGTKMTVVITSTIQDGDFFKSRGLRKSIGYCGKTPAESCGVAMTFSHCGMEIYPSTQGLVIISVGETAKDQRRKDGCGNFQFLEKVTMRCATRQNSSFFHIRMLII
jgi:hypothetical protein